MCRLITLLLSTLEIEERPKHTRNAREYIFADIGVTPLRTLYTYQREH